MSSLNPLPQSIPTQNEPQKPSDSSQASKKTEPHDEAAASPAPEEPEEEGKRGAKAPPPLRSDEEEVGRERLKRHRVEMAGRVWIPDTWGQEDLLKDWIDCAAFDASLVGSTIMMARDSLAQQGRRATPASTRLRIRN